MVWVESIVECQRLDDGLSGVFLTRPRHAQRETCQAIAMASLTQHFHSWQVKLFVGIALENDKISFVKLGNTSPHMNAATKATIKLLYELFDEPLTFRTIHSNTSITILNIELRFI
ncbi:hypothetical protein DPMN_096038 [Dreissena polymorpha]|uniref:Uncharacterized protein n=1 Tax=Dreissena polymorpha TaxID=45954 RepID=A0A9D4R448_DREPO|nr:hypothetical protein DPMN_096038 [Dreissena polymorpha]